jgi:predicted aspartyl protease
MVLCRLFVPFLVCGSIGSIAHGQNPRRHGRLLTIPVRVNDEIGKFLIDTGSSHSALDRSFAQRLGLKETGITSVQKNYSLEDLPTVTAERFQFGNKVWSDISFIDIDLEPMSQTLSVTLAGVLGTDFLATACVRLLYSSGTGEVVASTDHAGTPVRLKKAQDVFFVPVQIGTSNFEMLLDTGTNLTAVSYSAWRRLPFSRTYGALVNGIRTAGTVHDSALGCAPTMSVGDAVLRDQPIRVVQSTQAGNFASKAFAGLLGSDVLEHFDLTLDFSHSLIYLKPDPTYQADPYAFVTIGIQFFRVKTGAFSVASVWKPSPAKEAGILVGDQIISVNGQNSIDLDLDSFSELLHQPPGTHIKLEIMRRAGRVVVNTSTRRLACVSAKL